MSYGVSTSERLVPACESDDHPAALRAAVEETDLTACRRAAGILDALGDFNRLRIVLLLSRGEMCVSDLTAALGDNLSAVSQRLKLLRAERIVRTRREGKHVYYALEDQHIAQLVSNAVDHAAEG